MLDAWDIKLLRWRVSKLIFARAENKLFLVWRSEEPGGCQQPYKLMGYVKGAGLLTFVLRRALRERGVSLFGTVEWNGGME